ncbi:MAG: DUF4169 family protein [Pseudomonadota bacterium]
MAEIVNLKRARKRKADGEARQKANENAARFGRTKVKREQDKQETAWLNRQLDRSRRESDKD